MRPNSRRRTRGFVLAALLAGWAGCSSPITPTTLATVPPIPSQPIVHVVNTPPTIKSISVSVTRAEVNQDVTVSAQVADAETPIDNLTYTWSAPVGTFSGSGRTVTWRLAKGAVATPVDVVVTLVVTEQYQDVDDHNVPVTRTNTVTGTSPSFRVHDSTAEISTIAVRFLVDYFGNSSVSPTACVVDFWDGCSGKNAEISDIQINRANFLLISASATVQNIAFNGDMTSAGVDVACSFHDRYLATGAEGVSSGICSLTAVYQTGRWWLCDSHFAGTCGSCPPSPAFAGRRVTPMTMMEFFMAGIRKE